MMTNSIVYLWRLCSICFLCMLGHDCLAQFEGKIFTTPEERAYLDALRTGFLRDSREQGFDISETGPPPLPEPEQDEPTVAPVIYTLGGILTRSDGSRTVWLNNRPVAETELPANMKLIADGAGVVLRIGAGANFFTLKAGQTVNISTGKIVEAYQRAPAANADNTGEPAVGTGIAGTAAQLQTDNSEGIRQEAAPEASPAETGDRETP